MKLRQLYFLLVILLCVATNSAFANDAHEIKNILYDITKYEKQFAGKTTARKTNVNRALKLLTLTRQRLDQLSDKTDPGWKMADQRHKQLISKLNGFLKQNSAVAIDNSSPVDESAKAVNRSSAKSAMISQQRVRIKKIKRDIESVIASMDAGGVKPFQSADYVDRYKKSYDRHKQSLMKYNQFSSDADVISANNKLKEMENMLVFGQQQAAKTISGLGDVQLQLKDIDSKMHAMKIPTIPVLPLKQGEIKIWLTQLASLRKHAVIAYKELEPIKKDAYLPNNRFTVQSGADYDFNDVNRMQRGLKDIASKVSSHIKTLDSNLETNIKMIYSNLSTVDILNPTDALTQTNSFLGKGSAKRVRDSLQKDLDLVTEAMSFATILKNDVSLRKKQILADKIKRSMVLYEENHALTLELVRMPKAVTTDSKLLAAAKKTLANKKYGVGQIQHMVINSDKVHRSKTTSQAEFNDVDVSLSGKITLKGTSTTYHYKWDEFQVATVEPDAGKLYLFYNTLKFFTSGDSTTPLNSWVLNKRFQGSEIPKANVHQ